MNLNPICSIKFIKDGSSLDLDIFSKFTCIIGDNSGEGKTEFFTEIEDGINDRSITIESSLPFAVAHAATIETQINTENITIFMIDEFGMIRSEFLPAILKSKHIFICITRGFDLHFDYGYYSIHFLKRKNDWFILEQPNILNVTNNIDYCDKIITEADHNRSENQLLSVYFSNIIPSKGRDKIEKKLRNTNEKILVLADLGNIGVAYRILSERVQDNPNIMFYDYQCFEELLYNCDLVKSLNNKITADVCNFLSLERYYSFLLEKSTKWTNLEYKHGKPLAQDFLDVKNFYKVFDSVIGKGLLNLILNRKTKCGNYLLSNNTISGNNNQLPSTNNQKYSSECVSNEMKLFDDD